jgi:histidinol dehydrogenase
MIINAANWQRRCLNEGSKQSKSTEKSLQEKVSEILTDMRKNGDLAIDQYAMQFDQNKVRRIKLKSFEKYELSSELAESIQLAAKRIEAFCKFQKEGVVSRSFEDETGSYGQVVKPIERIGAYIPGGRYPLISTALMTLIPARVAGCPVRIACSPSDNPALLAAASLAGATEFIQIGGVQAIGALSQGYQQTEAVDLIVGPGNAWVNEAKKQVQSQVKIDGLAGPSELLAICDDKQPVEWIALDALAQAEHDPMACSLIVSDSIIWLKQLQQFIESRQETKALIDNRQIELILANSKEDLIEFSQQYAPEHLMLCHALIDKSELTNYGSLFLGANSAVALGDYITGPNHTLPTLGYARQTGGLNVNTYLRVLTTQSVTDAGRTKLSKSAMTIADAEGLKYHYESLKVRSS